MTPITRNISPDVDGTLRTASCEFFVIKSNLEIEIQIRVQHWASETLLKQDAILADETLSQTQKARQLARYADFLITRKTEGSWIDPVTGNFVEEGTAGAVTQLQYFQAVTLGRLRAMGMAIGDDTPIMEIVYSMIAAEIDGLDERKIF